MKYSKLSHVINYSLSAHQDVFYSNEQMGFDAENKPKVRFKPEYRMFSSPEPKAHGELIVYRSVRRPYVCASVRKHFKHEYLHNQWAYRNQILTEASLGRGKGCNKFWVRSDQNSGFHGNR